MSIEEESIATVKRFVSTYNKSVRQAIEQFYSEDFEWMEAPSPAFPKGRSGGRNNILDAVSFSEKTLTDESLKIVSIIASDNKVAIECIFTATLISDETGTPAGTNLKARGAMFMTVKDGKITSSHEYICFETP